jgi:CO/xanthine dehydrogenase FAD-binding subunit
MGYLKPDNLEEALDALAAGPWTPLAGGTDLYPATGNACLAGDILDLGGLSKLKGITETAAGFRLGAAVTWSELIRTSLPPAFDALKQAAREVGGVQIQNAGTIAGNLANASPAADGVPALLILDAAVELQSRKGGRRLALGDFIQGVRATARRPDELMTAILVPRQRAGGHARFEKLGARKYLVISIAMAAARVLVRDGVIAEAALAVGACSPVAKRIGALEAAIVGAEATQDLALRLDCAPLKDALGPIDDLRASAGYREEAAAALLRQALAGAIESAAS